MQYHALNEWHNVFSFNTMAMHSSAVQVQSELHPLDTAYAKVEQGYEIFTSESDLHGENKIP